MSIVNAPEFGTEMTPAHPSEEARALLARRRSTSADMLTEPGPDDDALAAILAIAARAPDHRRVVPFRFLIFKGEARERAGAVIAAAYRSNDSLAGEDRVAVEAHRFLRAPVVVAVIARIDRTHRTPEWEQMLTNGAVCQNLLLAASAHGFAAQWITEWYAYDAQVCRGFGLAPEEKIAGFIYLGAAKEPPRERQRPVMAEIVSRF